MDADTDKINNYLKWLAVVGGFLYTFVYLLRTLRSYLNWRATGLESDWGVTDNPQSLTCFVLIFCSSSTNPGLNACCCI